MLSRLSEKKNKNFQIDGMDPYIGHYLHNLYTLNFFNSRTLANFSIIMSQNRSIRIDRFPKVFYENQKIRYIDNPIFVKISHFQGTDS